MWRTATRTVTPMRATCRVSIRKRACGLVTDVCLKRKIRNYVETVKENDPRFGIYIKDGVPLNASDRSRFGIGGA